MTVLRWIKAGKLKAHRIGKEYRVPESEIKRILEGKIPDKVVIYARVPSRDQKEDLERHVEYLKNYCSSRGYQVAKILTRPARWPHQFTRVIGRGSGRAKLTEDLFLRRQVFC